MECRREVRRAGREEGGLRFGNDQAGGEWRRSRKRNTPVVLSGNLGRSRVRTAVEH